MQMALAYLKTGKISVSLYFLLFIILRPFLDS